MTMRIQSRSRREKCDRCGENFEEGYTYPALGYRVSLCDECAQDLEESVRSYGEPPAIAKQRFLDRLRRIGVT